MHIVTPLAGVWIEIAFQVLEVQQGNVTPLAGVWIEIVMLDVEVRNTEVTPLAGVWIEIVTPWFIAVCAKRHSPCGSVD